MQILTKLVPQLPPITAPPPLAPLGVKNFFGRFQASIYVQPIPFGPKN